MNVKIKNQNTLFLLNGDKKKIAEEKLNASRMALRAVGLSLRLALENKTTTGYGARDVRKMADGLFNESPFWSISEDGFCFGGSLAIVSSLLNLAYDKWFKRGSRKTKTYILDAMKHLLSFAELAEVDFCYLDLVKIKYENGEKEFEEKAVA